MLISLGKTVAGTVAANIVLLFFVSVAVSRGVVTELMNRNAVSSLKSVSSQHKFPTTWRRGKMNGFTLLTFTV